MASRNLRIARAYTTAALALTAVTGCLATCSLWCLAPGLYVAGLLALCAVREHAIRRAREAAGPAVCPPLTDAEQAAFNDLAERLRADTEEAGHG